MMGLLAGFFYKRQARGSRLVWWVCLLPCAFLALYQGFTGTGLQGLCKVASGLGGVLLLFYVSFQWSSNWMAVFSQTDPRRLFFQDQTSHAPMGTTIHPDLLS